VFIRPEITAALPIIYEEEKSIVSEEEKDLERERVPELIDTTQRNFTTERNFQ
jgi:hypothetical protein